MDDLIGTLVIKTIIVTPAVTRSGEVLRGERFKRVTLATYYYVTRDEASERFNEFMRLNVEYNPGQVNAEWICHCRVA